MIIGIAIFIFLLLLVSTVFSLMNIGNEKLLKGITILGIDVGGLTAEEAQGQIEDAINSRFHDENNNLILKRNETEIIPCEKIVISVLTSAAGFIDHKNLKLC